MLDAIRFHLTHVIAARFPPGVDRDRWLSWLAQIEDIGLRRVLGPDELHVRGVASTTRSASK